MTEEFKPSYYSIIPANVRYDDELIPHAKLLYGEITSLCNKHGFCWATNNYFAKLYKKNTNTISLWINQLKSRGYIEITLIYKDNSKEIDKRIIKIKDPLPENVEGGITEKREGGITENLKENNTSINNTRKNIVNPTLEQIKEYVQEKNYNIDCNKFYEYYSSTGWRDKNNKPVKSWKHKLILWNNNSTTNKPFKDYE